MKREGRRTTVFTRRALAIMGVQTAAIGLLAAKLYRVQVEEGARYSTLAESNRVSARLLAPTRARYWTGSARWWRAIR